MNKKNIQKKLLKSLVISNIFNIFASQKRNNKYKIFFGRYERSTK